MSDELIERVESELSKPLHIDKIKTRENYGGGGALSYIEAHEAIREANRIFGHLGWSRETVLCEIVCTSPYKNNGKDMVAVAYRSIVRVSVLGVVRDGTGYGDGQASVGRAYSAHELAAKEAESDATKRALMTFGDPFGLALYEKDKSKARVTNEREDAVQNAASKNKDSRDLYSRLQGDIDAAGDDLTALETWANHPPNIEAIKSLPEDWQTSIRQRYKDALIQAKRKNMEMAT